MQAALPCLPIEVPADRAFREPEFGPTAHEAKLPPRREASNCLGIHGKNPDDLRRCVVRFNAANLRHAMPPGPLGG